MSGLKAWRAEVLPEWLLSWNEYGRLMTTLLEDVWTHVYELHPKGDHYMHVGQVKNHVNSMNDHCQLVLKEYTSVDSAPTLLQALQTDVTGLAKLYSPYVKNLYHLMKSSSHLFPILSRLPLSLSSSPPNVLELVVLPLRYFESMITLMDNLKSVTSDHHMEITLLANKLTAVHRAFASESANCLRMQDVALMALHTGAPLSLVNANRCIIRRGCLTSVGTRHGSIVCTKLEVVVLNDCLIVCTPVARDDSVDGDSEAASSCVKPLTFKFHKCFAAEEVKVTAIPSTFRFVVSHAHDDTPLYVFDCVSYEECKSWLTDMRTCCLHTSREPLHRDGDGDHRHPHPQPPPQQQPVVSVIRVLRELRDSNAYCGNLKDLDYVLDRLTSDANLYARTADDFVAQSVVNTSADKQMQSYLKTFVMAPLSTPRSTLHHMGSPRRVFASTRSIALSPRAEGVPPSLSLLSRSMSLPVNQYIPLERPMKKGQRRRRRLTRLNEPIVEVSDDDESSDDSDVESDESDSSGDDSSGDRDVDGVVDDDDGKADDDGVEGHETDVSASSPTSLSSTKPITSIPSPSMRIESSPDTTTTPSIDANVTIKSNKPSSSSSSQRGHEVHEKVDVNVVDKGHNGDDDDDDSDEDSGDSVNDETHHHVPVSLSIDVLRGDSFSTLGVSHPVLALNPDDVPLPTETFVQRMAPLWALWEFPMIGFARQLGDRVLPWTSYGIMLAHDMFSIFNINVNTFMRWIVRISQGYRSENPYHNAIHAADVLQATHALISQNPFSSIFTDEEKLSLLLSAMVHDYDHVGTNNAYLVNTKDDLAITYNDMAVLESHHVASSFRLLLQDRYNFFLTNDTSSSACDSPASLAVDGSDVCDTCDTTHDSNGDDPVEGSASAAPTESSSAALNNLYHRLRPTMIDLVLATDFAKHFDITAKFKAKCELNSLSLDTNDDRRLLMHVILKISDVSNPTRQWDTCQWWAKRVIGEFFIQGDRERAAGLSVSPMMDRSATCGPKSQIGFIQFVVRPLVVALVDLYPSIGFLRDYLDNNLAEWERYLAQQGEGLCGLESLPDVTPQEGFDVNDPPSVASLLRQREVMTAMVKQRRLESEQSKEDEV